MTLRPIAAASVTLASATGLLLLSPRWAGSAFAALLLATFLFVQARSHSHSKAARTLLVWTLPFVLPLVAIHGVLNSAYPVTSLLLDAIPVRSEGVEFGYDVAVRVVILSIVGAYWLSVDRDEFVEALLRLGLPASLIMIAMQGLVMARQLQHRIDAVYQAQRARGIPVASSFLKRLRSFPALLVPVVVGTLVEAEARVPVLLSHGYGRKEPIRRPARPVTLADWLTIFFPWVLLAGIAAWDAWA